MENARTVKTAVAMIVLIGGLAIVAIPAYAQTAAPPAVSGKQSGGMMGGMSSGQSGMMNPEMQQKMSRMMDNCNRMMEQKKNGTIGLNNKG